jgi:hypothetical protein
MNSPQVDIFISYTHNDNLPPGEGQKGWVEQFHRSLLALIKQIYEKEPNIWRDPKTHGNDIIKDDVREKITAAKLLVTVLSPKYLTSRWCLRELRWFVKSTKDRELLVVGAVSPVFKVAKTRTDFKKHPHVIRGTPGYDFYHYDETTEYIEHFKQGLGVPYDVRYWDNLDRLAQDIVKTLRAAISKHVEPVPASSPEKVVYLAEPSPELQSEHKRIRDELKARHYQVLPEESPFTGATRLRRKVREYLKRSRASIHLVGRSYLELPEKDRVDSFVCLQNNLAAERLGSSDFSRLIWVPQGVRLTDLQQMELVGHNSQSWLNGTEVLQSSLDELRAVMLEKLENRRQTHGQSRFLRKTIYLIYDKQDQHDIEAIHNCLFGQGYEVTTPSFEEDQKSVARHKSKLATCDAVLIYYGKGNQDWIESHLDYLETTRGIRSIDESESGVPKPLLAKAIYISPPCIGHKRIFNTRRAKVIKKDESFNCEQLQEFFDQIERNTRRNGGNN